MIPYIFSILVICGVLYFFNKINTKKSPRLKYRIVKKSSYEHSRDCSMKYFIEERRPLGWKDCGYELESFDKAQRFIQDLINKDRQDQIKPEIIKEYYD